MADAAGEAAIVRLRDPANPALSELVGLAGLLVPPRDVDRLAVALATAWTDDRVHAGIAAAAREAGPGRARTWADVARETRAIYLAVGRPGPDRPDGA